MMPHSLVLVRTHESCTFYKLSAYGLTGAAPFECRRVRHMVWSMAAGCPAFAHKPVLLDEGGGPFLQLYTLHSFPSSFPLRQHPNIQHIPTSTPRHTHRCTADLSLLPAITFSLSWWYELTRVRVASFHVLHRPSMHQPYRTHIQSLVSHWRSLLFLYLWMDFRPSFSASTTTFITFN